MTRPELVIIGDQSPCCEDDRLAPCEFEWQKNQPQGYDLLMSEPATEFLLINQWKSGEFIANNPTFRIIGVGLHKSAHKTPYGDIGAVIE